MDGVTIGKMENKTHHEDGQSTAHLYVLLWRAGLSAGMAFFAQPIEWSFDEVTQLDVLFQKPLITEMSKLSFAAHNNWLCNAAIVQRIRAPYIYQRWQIGGQDTSRVKSPRGRFCSHGNPSLNNNLVRILLLTERDVKSVIFSSNHLIASSIKDLKWSPDYRIAQYSNTCPEITERSLQDRLILAKSSGYWTETGSGTYYKVFWLWRSIFTGDLDSELTY